MVLDQAAAAADYLTAVSPGCCGTPAVLLNALARSSLATADEAGAVRMTAWSRFSSPGSDTSTSGDASSPATWIRIRRRRHCWISDVLRAQSGHVGDHLRL